MSKSEVYKNLYLMMQDNYRECLMPDWMVEDATEGTISPGTLSMLITEELILAKETPEFDNTLDFEAITAVILYALTILGSELPPDKAWDDSYWIEILKQEQEVVEQLATAMRQGRGFEDERAIHATIMLSRFYNRFFGEMTTI